MALKTRDQEAKSSGIRIETTTITNIKTTDGLLIKKGDAILLKVRGETIACRFTGLSEGGYFVTVPFDAAESGVKVQYRLGSIAACYKIAALELETGPEGKEPAGEEAAEPAAQQALAEA